MIKAGDMGCQPLIKYCQTPKDFPLKKIRMSYNKPGKIIQFRKWSICCVTSVIGGCFDEEFSPWSAVLFEEFRAGLKIPVVSDITLQEISMAPSEVQKVLESISDTMESVLLSREAAALAQAYLDEKIITDKYLLDAQHIALASIEKVDVLVSWNFKHIVNLNRIRLYNSVNLKKGYALIDIRSPREVINEDI